MLLQGTIHDIAEREKYTRIVVVKELGFQSDIYLLRVNPEILQDKLEVGCGVLITGKYTSYDGCKRFALDSIMKCDFKSCGVCKLPLTSRQCVMKHDGDIKRIKGQWTVLFKNFSGGSLDLFLQNDNMVFPVSISSKSWLYHVLDEINQGEIVEIDGWRQKDKVNLTLCRKVYFSEDI